MTTFKREVIRFVICLVKLFLHLQEFDESRFLQFLPKIEFLGDIFLKEDILNGDSEEEDEEEKIYQTTTTAATS